MGFAEIIQIIMQILAFIAGLFNPKTMQVRYVAFVTDFDCTPAVWSEPAKISGGVFTGKVETVCTFEGKGGGGVAALRAHLIEQLPQDAGTFEGTVENYQGIPSMAFKTSVELGEGVTAHGTTHIATNGFTVLRDVFESSSIAATGNGKYVKSMTSEMAVAKGLGDGYSLRVSQSLKVQKPFFASSSEFQSSLMEQAEESLMDRAVGAVQEMAGHL